MPGDNIKKESDFFKALSVVNDGVIITLEVAPGSRKELFPTGYNPWREAIGISVKAPATDGKANKAVIALVAHTLKISKGSVTLIGGHTSHLKRVLVRDVTIHEIMSLFS